MERREFIKLLGGAAAAWPLTAHGQQPALPVIGFLSTRSSHIDQLILAPFREGLADFGYVEGRNVAIQYRWAEGNYNRLPALAADLVDRQVTVIVAIPDPAAFAAKAATAIIPIVFISGDDPVKIGLVDSLSRPGGNLTGFCGLVEAVTAKQIAVLHELVPNATSIALLVNPNEPAAESESRVSDAQTAASAVGNQLIILKASTEHEIDVAFEILADQKIGALLVPGSPLFFNFLGKLVALANRHAIPAMFWRRDFPKAGGLISYGPSPSEVNRQVGVYTGRILKGAKPADLPVVQASKLELVINLITAKTLGISVPNVLLTTADEVIE
jgi:putative ABC transport system substrate-binding protein